MVEKVVHDPDKPSAPKPKLPDEIFERMRGWFRDDVAGLQEFAGRRFEGWNEYLAPWVRAGGASGFGLRSAA